jgi:hypothetical protein
MAREPEPKPERRPAPVSTHRSTDAPVTQDPYGTDAMTMNRRVNASGDYCSAERPGEAPEETLAEKFLSVSSNKTLAGVKATGRDTIRVRMTHSTSALVTERALRMQCDLYFVLYRENDLWLRIVPRRPKR